MQKIVPNIWFDGNAAEAADYYAQVLPNTAGRVLMRYPDEGLPDFQKHLAGEPLTAEIVIGDYQIVFINAGPEFAPNESVSFMLNSICPAMRMRRRISTWSGPDWSTAATCSATWGSTRSARGTARCGTDTASPGS